MNMIETIKIMLDALENHTAIKHPQQIHYRDRAIEAGRQAIAEAEKHEVSQEPVMGVEVKRIASGGFVGNVWWIHENLQEGVFHLYTHPQPKREWVELTDEEIDKTHETQVWDARRSYARAIEAKLKEKNT